MTLYQRLVTGMLGIFLILISSVFITQYNTARHYLIEQQTIGVNNLLTAMVMATLPHLSTQDIDGTKAVIDSIYRLGFHGTTTLNFLTKKRLSQAISTQNQDSQNNGLKNTPLTWHDPHPPLSPPQWFRSLVKINPVTAQSDVVWNNTAIASIEITGSSHNAYSKLWKATTHLFINMLIVFIIGVLLLAVFLRQLLSPLIKLQQKSNAIAQQQFGEAIALPAAKDLRTLVTSFNFMSQKIKSHLEQKAHENEQLRKIAYQDPITQLGNLDYLKAKFTGSTHSRSTLGGLVLLRSNLISQHLEENNIDSAITDGFDLENIANAESLSRLLAQRLSSLLDDNSTIASISHYEFVIITTHCCAQRLNDLAEKMMHLANNLQSDPFRISTQHTMLGLVINSKNDDISNMLHKAKIAIQEASLVSGKSIALFDQDSNPDLKIRTKQEWKQLIKNAVNQRQIKLHTQYVINRQHQPIHQEIFAYIEQGDERFSAAQFIDSIEYETEGLLLDMHVLELVFVRLSSAVNIEPVTVNISIYSINSDNFLRWLTSKLQSHPHLSEQLIFELPENAFIDYPASAQQLCDVLAQYQYQYGIDKFGRNFSAIRYLNQFSPSYVKLDFAYTINIDQQQQTDVLNAILRIADRLMIKVIATQIETSQQLEQLAEFSLYGYQGFVTAQLLQVEHQN
ncbi:EAL domain-containing protein [Vibrio sp. S11_S32]|uniref:bifunctional diguanylate cyclase/phosphodiesterase n=1 Tax=Vibrio sp. S11_S32 TaxID=2720225 RepID=UPI001680B4CE|nr:EAL domain-containing protein [Vibrio sp. S11_S32]MBD1577463.1 EAL domain-containing protein [Vibrio sp. S11_S32]